MAIIALVLVPAAVIGLIGAALGVRNLKRQTNITIERGVPRVPFPTAPVDGIETP